MKLLYDQNLRVCTSNSFLVVIPCQNVILSSFKSPSKAKFEPNMVCFEYTTIRYISVSVYVGFGLLLVHKYAGLTKYQHKVKSLTIILQKASQTNQMKIIHNASDMETLEI